MLLGREVMLRGLLSRHGVPFARRGRAVTAEQWFVVRGNRSGKKVWQSAFSCSHRLANTGRYCGTRPNDQTFNQQLCVSFGWLW